MTAPALLVAEDLDKEYRSGPELVRVLRGASLALRQGEMVALVGASGVGKSTLLHLLGEMSALENAMIPALLVRRPVEEARELATAALAEVGLGDRLGHRPGELSGGEQQRVAIARALVNAPKLILADEPTGNLDPKTSEVIYDLFLRLQAERGIAFLVATHNPDLARRAERGYRLVEGRAREIE